MSKKRNEMNQYNIICQDNKSALVCEYTPILRRDDFYPSEASLETDFKKRLQVQGYEYVNTTNEAGLITNLRRKLEKLNDYTFTNAEWERFFRESIFGANEGIVEKTRRINDCPVQKLIRDDGSTKNNKLIDKKCIHSNSLQVL